MSTLSLAELRRLLHPYVTSPEDVLVTRLSLYLDLLLKWNARMNLTAIRSPAEIVTRHFGESLFAAQHLGNPTTLLDYGSGAGFPGIPTALLLPETRVTLAESQNKKAAFLREAVRVLGLSTEVWSRRAEEMTVETKFDCVALRAVDDMNSAIETARGLVGKTLVLLTTKTAYEKIPLHPSFELLSITSIPDSDHGRLVQFFRI